MFDTCLVYKPAMTFFEERGLKVAFTNRLKDNLLFLLPCRIHIKLHKLVS